MPELPEKFRASDREKQRYIKQLMKIHADPVKAIKTGKRLKNASLALSAIVLSVVMMFPNTISGLIQDILICIFAIFATIAAVYTTAIRNIPLGLEIMDWDKVKKINDELGFGR